MSDPQVIPPPPPAFCRLPPDGHEFPPNCREPSKYANSYCKSVLSRKSSGSSTGSSDYRHRPSSKGPGTSCMRHDENSIKSVRAKIALFSHSNSLNTETTATNKAPNSHSLRSTSSAPLSTSASSLTRSLTQSDVRFDTCSTNGRLSPSKPSLAFKQASNCHRSMTNVSSSVHMKLTPGGKSASHVDLVSNLKHERSSPCAGAEDVRKKSPGAVKNVSTRPPFPGMRSQSMLDIVKDPRKASSPSVQKTKSKSAVVFLSSPVDSATLMRHQVDDSTMVGARQRNTLTRLKSLVIPEGQTQHGCQSSELSSTTPSWKVSPFGTSLKGATLPKCSPTIKRKPVTLCSPGALNSTLRTNGGPALANEAFKRFQKSQSVDAILTGSKRSMGRKQTTGIRSDDSDIDSAMSSSRSSLSYSCSVSPPLSPCRLKKKKPGSSCSGTDGNEVNIPEMKIGTHGINCRKICDTYNENCAESLSATVLSSSVSEKATLRARRSIPAVEASLALGKPASRSSSFTIVERKRSSGPMDGMLSESRKGSENSSQDSLATVKSFSCNSPKRNSGEASSFEGTVGTFSKASVKPDVTDGSRVANILLRIQGGTANFADISKKKSSLERSRDFRNISSNFEVATSKFSSPPGSNNINVLMEKPKIPAANEISHSPHSRRPTRDANSGSPPGLAKISTDEEISWKSPDRSGSGAKTPTSDRSASCVPDETEQQAFEPASSPPLRSLNATPTNCGMNPNSCSTPNSISVSFPDRKYSAPAFVNQTDSSVSDVKMRNKANSVPSRPSSLIETGGPETRAMAIFEVGNLGDGGRGSLSRAENCSTTSTSQGSSQADLLECTTSAPDQIPKSSLEVSNSREVLEVGKVERPRSRGSGGEGSGKGGGQCCMNVNDIRRAFEKAEQSLVSSMQDQFEASPSHNRMSSLDSTTSEESSIPTPHNHYESVSSLVCGRDNRRDHYGSISSLASSTSLISPQELQGLIDEANQSLEESGTPSHEIMVVVLHREFTAGSIGITLAGGADYESKDITVHKVIPGTLADRDGRIQKGDRVLSINGRSTKGVSHREALTILKAPRTEVVLVVSRSRSVTPAEGSYERTDFAAYNYINMSSSGRPPKILESPLDSKSLLSDAKFVDVPRGPPITVILKKEGTGLGFSLEGGKDSPLGDRPLVIKKLFTGGAADKNGSLKVGDEIISVNSTDCSRMSRIEAWNFMKKLGDGTACLVVRHKLVGESSSNGTVTIQPADTKKDFPPSSSAATPTPEQVDAIKVEAKR